MTRHGCNAESGARGPCRWMQGRRAAGSEAAGEVNAHRAPAARHCCVPMRTTHAPSWSCAAAAPPPATRARCPRQAVRRVSPCGNPHTTRSTHTKRYMYDRTGDAIATLRLTTVSRLDDCTRSKWRSCEGMASSSFSEPCICGTVRVPTYLLYRRREAFARGGVRPLVARPVAIRQPSAERARLPQDAALLLIPAGGRVRRRTGGCQRRQRQP